MMAAGWLYLLVSSLLLMNIQVIAATQVAITILESALAKGAACLDGTPPAYYYSEGSGDGVSNWIVYLEGGGWCNSTETCVDKSHRFSGSSRTNQVYFQYFLGLLDNDCEFNPDFCNWHKVSFHYCDGSSFSSNVERVDPKTNLTFRGARIFDALIEEMMAKGLGNAQNAVLAGSSAGGLSTILHCDMFRSLLPNTGRVKCISDSGFFIRGEGLPGIELREIYFSKAVVETHELTKLLPTTCTSKRNADLCFFPEYLVGDIQTPLFIIESAFDSYQVGTNLFPDADANRNCTVNIALCNTTQLNILRDFRSTFIETLMKLNNSSTRGMFVHSCYRHVHINGRSGWTCSAVGGNVLANKTIGQAVRDWYFDRSSFNEIDTQNDSPFICTRDDERDPKFRQKCLATLHPH